MAQSNVSSSPRFDTSTVSTLGWLALALVFLTGVLHLWVGIVEGRIPLVLAGVAFLAAMPLYLADYHRRLLVLLAIPFTAVQIPLWYVVNAGEFTTLGYLDKAIQLVLVAVLVVMALQSRR